MATLTTPRRAYPYPDGAERVMDGDNAIAALAGAIDADVGRLWTPPGVVAAGGAWVQAGGSSVAIPLDALVEGNGAMFDNANDCIKPLGGGVYLVHAYGTAQLPLKGGNMVAAIRFGLLGGGSTVVASQQIYQPLDASPASWSLMAVLGMPDNYVFRVWGGCTINVFPTWTVARFGCWRLGSGFGTAALERIAEILPDAKPAELEELEP